MTTDSIQRSLAPPPRRRVVAAAAASAITVGAIGFAAPPGYADVGDSFLGIAYNTETMGFGLFTGVRYQIYDLSPQDQIRNDVESQCNKSNGNSGVICATMILERATNNANTCGAIAATGPGPLAPRRTWNYAVGSTKFGAEEKARQNLMTGTGGPVPQVGAIHIVVSACSRDGMPPPPTQPKPPPNATVAPHPGGPPQSAQH
ncbi:MAG: hypothetical protein QOH60_3733 [Mycobacterium sp.]|jgi:hypothetical protein|nr:hypothetical protein [Mycobacterium sp.]